MGGIRKVLVRKVLVRKDGPEEGRIHVEFGPHYMLDLREEGGKVVLELRATHHGFRADASEIGGELERFIAEIREKHPSNAVD